MIQRGMCDYVRTELLTDEDCQGRFVQSGSTGLASLQGHLLPR